MSQVNKAAPPGWVRSPDGAGEQKNRREEHHDALHHVGPHYRDKTTHSGVNHHDEKDDEDRGLIGQVQKNFEQIADALENRRHIKEAGKQDDQRRQDPRGIAAEPESDEVRDRDGIEGGGESPETRRDPGPGDPGKEHH